MSRLFLGYYGKVTAGRALPRSGEAVRSPLGRPQPVGLHSDPRRAFPLGPENKRRRPARREPCKRGCGRTRTGLPLAG